MRLFIGIGILFASSVAFAANCPVAIKPGSVKLEWTAYKFTEKKAVPGTFKDVQLTLPPPTKKDHLKGLQFKVDTATVDTGDAARDTTLREAFFNLMKSTVVEGQVTSTSNTSLTVTMIMNGISRAVPFSLKKDKALYTAQGKIDVLDFALGKSLESLSKVCKELHKGADGVSKTWSTVDLKISAEAVESCVKK